MEYKDVFPSEGHVQRLYCTKCESYLDLVFTEFSETVSGIIVQISNFPVLRCISCNEDHLPDDSRFAIIQLFERAHKIGKSNITIIRQKIPIQYNQTRINFNYDADDYRYIPGLMRTINDGYLTPVFFNKQVLVKFEYSPDYRLTFGSQTYGNIRRNDDFCIPFGINRNGKVIMWLGDVGLLPETEQYYLRSENIDSDHSIGCEFYDGQIECIFTKLSNESKLFRARSDFLELCYKVFHEKIAHLDSEVLEIANTIKRPIIDTLEIQKSIADTLNKVYVESFDNLILERLLTTRGIDSAKLGTLKRLELLLKNIDKNENISGILSPFFVLYDLRVALSHLSSMESREIKMSTIRKRLILEGDVIFLEIYDAIVLGMTKSFTSLTEMLNKYQNVA
jgi:hypothetical protein